MKQNRIKTACAALAGLCALACVFLGLTYLLTGELCLFKGILGLPCPGCGMTRALLSMLRLDLSAALSWHPGVFALPLLPAALVLFLRGRRRAGGVLLALFAGVLLVVFLLRLPLLARGVPPLDFNRAAPLAPLFARWLG